MSWSGTPGKMSQVSTMTGGQNQLLSQLIQALQGGGVYGDQGLYDQGNDYLSDLYSQNPESFDRLSQPYMNQFQQQMAPGLAERFSAMGSGGARHSSGFNQAMAQAGSKLSAQLGSQFEQMRGQNLGNLMNMQQMPYNQAMGGLGAQSFQNVYQEPQQGMWAPILGGLAGGVTGGVGAGVGTGLGALISKYMSGSTRNSTPTRNQYSQPNGRANYI